MPGQTRPADSSARRAIRCFNGGPDNCPAKPAGPRRCSTTTTPLQWRAGQLPGQTAPRPSSTTSSICCFNGGPDNCPAKHRLDGVALDRVGASMEGRTIARPNIEVEPLTGPVVLVASMEGRTIARPNRANVAAWPAGSVAASMEGRTIARPNGPDANPTDTPTPASMEGRTIARPNGRPGGIDAPPDLRFNGGPDKLPGQTRSSPVSTTTVCRLQWRAGQLPGQT